MARTGNRNSISEIAAAITSSLVLEEVLAVVAGRVADAMDAQICDIYEYSPARDTLTCLAYWMEGREELNEPYVIHLADRPTWHAFLAGRAISEVHIDDLDLPPEERAVMEQWGEQATMSMPLVYGDEVIGVLGITDKRVPRRFDDDERGLFRELASLTAIAIHNAHIFRREEARGQRLVALLAASKGIAAELDADDVAARVAREAGSLLQGRESKVEVWMKDGEDGFNVVRASGRRGRRQARPAETDALARKAVSTGLAVQQRRARSSRLVAPISFKGEVAGLIDLKCRDGAEFTADEVELVQILATQAAVATENARLYETIEQQAITDDLTGLYNHRYFYERLRQEFKRSARYKIPLSLLMLDLDDFKLVNDRFGHRLGDEVLREIARVLLKQVRRDVDLAARYGGEEFAVLLPNTPSLGAQVVGDRLKRTVELLAGTEPLQADVGGEPAGRGTGAGLSAAATLSEASAPGASEAARLVGERIRHDVEVARFAGSADHPMQVTISVGVATWPGDAGDEEGLVAAADKALYLAKRLGKNRVESFS